MPLEDAIAKARDALKPPVLLVHHDDSDGLCAAAIAKKCLLDQGIEPTLVCVEKMFPEVVQNIHDFKGTVVYLDLASGNLDLVEEHCKQTTIIIDHHKAREPKDARILVVNPELHGTSGEQCTSSTLAYLFFSRKDQRLAQLAVIGATEIPGDLRGLNRLVMQESGVTISSTKSGESYKTLFGKTADSVAKDLTVLGAVGYYQGGPQKALDLCLFGYNRELKQAIKALDERRKATNRKLIQNMKLSESEHLQWFFVGDAYNEFGAKTIGTLCSYLSHRGVGPTRLLLGFMDVRKEVPGFMKLWRDYVKVSARAPPGAADDIKAGKVPGLGFLMRTACAAVGGGGDGHDYAASGFLPRGREAEFLDAMEKAVVRKTGVTLASFTDQSP